MHWFTLGSIVLVVTHCLAYKSLSDTDLKEVVGLKNPIRLDPRKGTLQMFQLVRLIRIGDLLPQLLIPRVADTDGNRKVRKFIKDHFEKLGWTIEEDTFTAGLPNRFGGNRSMTNLIMTQNTQAPRKLVLAAHYDSKVIFSDDGFSPVALNKALEQNVFVGATDSAAPVAMLMDVAEALNPLLKVKTGDTSLTMIFFDGEEAFGRWTDDDSIYGAKHLAEMWEKQTEAFRQDLPTHKTTNVLDSIEYFILLDLLGAKGSTVHDLYDASSWLFQNMHALEKKLFRLNLLREDADDLEDTSFFIARQDEKSYIDSRWIGDDHLPFATRGVKILHAIAWPFPKVWHTVQDDVNALDVDSIINWALILRAMVAEYLELDVSALTRSASTPARHAIKDELRTL